VLEILSIIVVGFLVAWTLADVLSWPFGEAFLWIQKKLGFPRNIRTGPEALIGELAVVVQPFVHRDDAGNWQGKVRLRNEMWSAKLPNRWH
jgi:hypothetical protein